MERVEVETSPITARLAARKEGCTIALLRETKGQDLLADLDAVVDRIAAQAEDRNEQVEERLRTLEAEQADLRQVQRRVAAIRAA